MYADILRLYPLLHSLAQSIIQTESARDFCVLVENIAKLPAELYALVIYYSPNSMLWRFARVIAWRSEPFECLRNTTIDILLPDVLGCWTRHDWQNRVSYYNGRMDQDGKELKFFRMGIDDLGIQSFQLLESQSALPGTTFPSCPCYIVDEASCLDDFNILSNVGYAVL